MAISERPEWTQARRQRMKARYPELSQADPDTVLAVDNYRAAQGQAPGDFTTAAMRLGATAAESVRNP